MPFLRAVVPIAEGLGVRLAVHLDDPPFPLSGLPRVVSTAADLRSVVAAVDSPANGLTFCIGSLGAHADNDVVAMAAEFAARANFAYLRNLIVEPDGSFHKAAHFDGGNDMIGVVAILLADDIGKRTNRGYSLIGRLKVLAELPGVMRTIMRLRSSACATTSR